MAGAPMAGTRGRGTGHARHRAAPARSARAPRARPRPDPPARVIDYRQDDWATLTYGQRKFFDWGGWLAVRPMDELPHWRVLMRRELEPTELDRVPARARTGDRRDAGRPRRARHGQQSRVRHRHADPHRQLPRPQGQLAGAPLPVADRRRDDPPPRRVRARVRPDRDDRARRADPRERPRRSPTTT